MIFSTIFDLALEKKKTVKKMGKEKQCVDLVYCGSASITLLQWLFPSTLNCPFQQGSLIIHLPFPALNFCRKVLKLIYW